MNAPMYDNSREGNDCYIYEHWHWEPGGTALRIKKVVGENSIPGQVSIRFDKIDEEEMPETVINWFLGIF